MTLAQSDTPAKSLPRRQHLTIMFTDLSESSSITRQMEPEEYSVLLDKMRDSFVAKVAEHGGSVIRIDGDGLIFIFGYPTVHEDAARRAIEAAIDLHEMTDELSHIALKSEQRLQLHTAIHSGMVLVKAGNLSVGHYEILGDATNLTAHLCDCTAPGEIIVSDECIGRSRKYFHITQQRSVKLKGRDKRILVNKIDGRAINNEDGISTQLTTTPFIGRANELQDLKRFVLEKSKTAKSILIHAEAGLGKSRLLRELSNELAQSKISVYSGICEAYLGIKPFQPIEQIAHSLLRSELALPQSESSTIKQLSNYLNKHPSEKNGHLQNPLKFEENFLSFLQSLYSEVFVIIIDDWQWVDSASKKIIEDLLKSGPPTLRIILASREVDRVFVEMNKLSIIALNPLKISEVSNAIKKLLPSVEPFTLHRIQKYSGGNPLYLEELCHAVKDSRFTFDNSQAGSWLSSLIFTRFSQLPKNLADVVKIAAVIGFYVPEWLLADISTEKPLTQILIKLRAADFLFPSERAGYLRFKHGITRDVIYQMVELSERKTLHLQVIQKLHERSKNLGEGEPYEQLAYHYGQSGNEVQSANYAIIAGDLAKKSFALDRAQAHYQLALENLYASERTPNTEKQINDTLRKFGQVAIVDPAWEQIDVLETARENAMAFNNLPMIAWIEFWLGFLFYGLGEPKKAISHLESAREKANKLSSNKLLVHINTNLGQAYGSACSYEKASQLMERGIQLKEQMGSGTQLRYGLAYSISCLGFVYADQGMFNKSDETFEKSRAIVNELGQEMSTWLANQWSASKIWSGDFVRGYELANQARQIAENTKSRYHYVMAKSLMLGAQLSESNDPKLISDLVESTDWLSSQGSQQFTSLNHGWLTRAFVHGNDYSQARHYAAKAFLRARKGDRLGEAMAARAMARAAKQNKDHKSIAYYMAWAEKSASCRNSVHESHKNQHCREELNF